MVDVSTDGGKNWIPLRGDYNTAPSGSTEGWVLQHLDLSPFVDQIVQVRFYFETLDATNNAFRGWRFDDVKVQYVGTPWLDASPLEGSIEGLATEDIVVTFNALQGRPAGLYEAAIDISSNDPGNPVIQLPVTMTVVAAPRIGLPGETVTLNSSIDLADGSGTQHHLVIAIPPVDDAEVRLQASGDFDDPSKTATLTAEAFILGSAGNASEDCGTVTQAFPVTPAQLRSLIADGVVDMAVQNSPQVGACAVNNHAVQLVYQAAREQLDLGSVDVGASATTLLEIVNAGDGELRITGIVSDSPAVTVTPSSLDIAPLGRAEVAVSFAPAAAGALTGELRLSSNDPVHGTITLAVTGESLVEPAIATVAPDTLIAALPPRSNRIRIKDGAAEQHRPGRA